MLKRDITVITSPKKETLFFCVSDDDYGIGGDDYVSKNDDYSSSGDGDSSSSSDDGYNNRESGSDDEYRNTEVTTVVVKMTTLVNCKFGFQMSDTIRLSRYSNLHCLKKIKTHSTATT